MHIIARLIRAALEACFERGKIDWMPAPGYGIPEMFQAECEIEFHSDWIGSPTNGYQTSGDFYVVMLNVLCLVAVEDITDDQCTYWYSEVLPEAI